MFTLDSRPAPAAQSGVLGRGRAVLASTSAWRRVSSRRPGCACRPDWTTWSRKGCAGLDLCGAGCFFWTAELRLLSRVTTASEKRCASLELRGARCLLEASGQPLLRWRSIGLKNVCACFELRGGMGLVETYWLSLLLRLTTRSREGFALLDFADAGLLLWLTVQYLYSTADY